MKTTDIISGRPRPFGADSTLIETGLNLIQQGLSIFNGDMRLIAFNRRFLEMYDLPPDQIKHGTTFFEINMFLAKRGEFGPGDPAVLSEERVERARRFEAHYFERIRPNGRRIAIEGNPLSEGGWITIYSDITESYRHEQILKAKSDLLSDRLLHHSGKLAETNRELAAANRALRETKAALEASEERMRAITRAMPAHIAYLDRNFIYRFSNNRFSDVMGVVRQDLVGKSLTDAYPPQIYKEVRHHIERAFSGQAVVVEYDMPQPDGGVRTIRSSYTPEHGEAESIEGIFVLSQDISDEKAATELFVRSKRMETTAQLTSGLAHDFSNILTIILGNLSRIGKPDIPADNRDDLIRSTERAARRGTRIIDNLMTFLFRQRLEAKQTNLSRILRELARLFSASVDERVRLELDVPEADIFAYLDEGAFQDAVLNVLFNARDAVEMQSGEGVIRLGVRLDEALQRVAITVTDDGPGFSDEALAQAEEPFFTTKPQGKGSGLGLAMVRNFIDRSNGRLEIKNGSNGGAAVTLHLPLASPETEGTPLSSAEAAPATSNAIRSTLVLVVDDDPDMRSLMRDYITSLGGSAIEASSAGEAETLVRSVPDISAMVSDIIMPGEMNGYELAQKLAETRPDLAIMLVSGLPHADRIMRAASAQFSVLRKPFGEKSFGKALAAILALKDKDL